MKANAKMKVKLMILASIIWFLAVSFITAQTGYQHIVADWLADPQGTSTQLESVVSMLIVVASFIPSGVLFAYPYVLKTFKDRRLLRVSVLSIVLALILFVPFSWYNFIVNFAK